jgi:hypothetical protein
MSSTRFHKSSVTIPIKNIAGAKVPALYFLFATHYQLTISQMAIFEAWLAERNFIPQGADVFGETIQSNMPYLIAAWIMSK